MFLTEINFRISPKLFTGYTDEFRGYEDKVLNNYGKSHE